MTYDTLLFDLDGTLYGTRLFFRGVFEDMARWLKKNGLIPDTDRFVDGVLALQDAKGTDYRTLLDDALRGLAIDAVHVVDLLAVYHSHDCRYLRMDSRDAALLSDLRSQGKTLFVVTNGSRAVQERKMAVLGIDAWMTEAVILDPAETGALKPDPGAFRRLAAQYPMDRAVMVGDRWDVDGRFAARCGIDFLGVYCHGD